MSTRAGRVSSSNSRRQARLRRGEAGEPSGAAGLGAGAGTGARTRRGGSCAASSAPLGLSIAPRRLPPRGPGGGGVDGAPAAGTQAAPTSPPWGAIGLAGAWGTRGTWSPGTGAQGPGEGRRERRPEADDGARSSGSGARCPGAGCGVRCQGVGGAEWGCGQSVRTAPLAAGSHWTARGGAEAGDTRGPPGGSARASPGRSGAP